MDKPQFPLQSSSSHLPDGGRRLSDTIRAWEQDPKRWQKLQWSGLDNNSDSENDSMSSDDAVHLENGEEEEVYSDSSSDPGSFEGINIDNGEFVVDDTVESYAEEVNHIAFNRDVQEMQSVVPAAPPPLSFVPRPHIPAAPAPPPLFVTVAGLTLPCMLDSDCQNVPEEEQKCVVCNEHSCSVVFVPCGHATTCLHCVHALFKTAETKHISPTCPECRANVAQVIRLYQ